MSKERLEEANKWLVRIKSLSTTKSNKEDAEYVNKHAEILEGLIEQNKRYREALEWYSENSPHGNIADEALEGEE